MNVTDPHAKTTCHDSQCTAHVLTSWCNECEGWHQPAGIVVMDDPPCGPLTPAEQAWWDEEIRRRYRPS